MEYFDILNEDGSKTGKIKERSLVHRDGDLHKTVHIWILRNNNKGTFDLLLQKRSKNKDSFPSCYDISSAGHVLAGDDYKESAIRELFEELGIKAKDNELKFIGFHKGKVETEFYGKKFKNHELSAVYLFMEKVKINKLILQKEEVESVKWIEINELIKGIKENKIKNCLFIDELNMIMNYFSKYLTKKYNENY